MERVPAPFGMKIGCVHRGDVRDLVPGVEQGADLPVVNARVGGMMDDRAHHDPHRDLRPGQSVSMWVAAGVLGRAPLVSSSSRAVAAIPGRSYSWWAWSNMT